MTGPDKLLHWLDSERDRQLDFLQRFARIDTANPPGDTRRAADLFRAFLDREGIAHRTEAPQAAHPNLIATFAGGAGTGRHLVLNGHLDVFPSATGRPGRAILGPARSTTAGCTGAARST